jgi:hypothetical protein
MGTFINGLIVQLGSRPGSGQSRREILKGLWRYRSPGVGGVEGKGKDQSGLLLFDRESVAKTGRQLME